MQASKSLSVTTTLNDGYTVRADYPRCRSRRSTGDEALAELFRMYDPFLRENAVTRAYETGLVPR